MNPVQWNKVFFFIRFKYNEYNYIEFNEKVTLFEKILTF